jgi:hypothetical protein
MMKSGRRPATAVAVVLVVVISILSIFRLRHSLELPASESDKNKHTNPVFPSSNSIQALALDPPTIVERATLSCNWSPQSNNTECVKLLSSRMNASAPFRRWLMLGDSTMWRLMRY